MDDLKNLTNEELAAHIKELRLIETRGFAIGDPGTTGRAIAALEEAWAEQDRRR